MNLSPPPALVVSGGARLPLKKIDTTRSDIAMCDNKDKEDKSRGSKNGLSFHVSDVIVLATITAVTGGLGAIWDFFRALFHR